MGWGHWGGASYPQGWHNPWDNRRQLSHGTDFAIFLLGLCALPRLTDPV